VASRIQASLTVKGQRRLPSVASGPLRLFTKARRRRSLRSSPLCVFSEVREPHEGIKKAGLLHSAFSRAVVVDLALVVGVACLEASFDLVSLE
jgi:hypothetical protein